MVPRVWHPFTQLQDFTPVGTVVGAEGLWLHLADGRRLADGIASWWTCLHGHRHPHLVQAVVHQAQAFDQVILADFDHAPAVNLTERLVALLPGDLNHVFFSDDGSTAVEVAIKLGWQAHRRAGNTRRNRLVAFEGGYHGDTLGAMRVGDRDTFAEPFLDLLGRVDLLPWNDADALADFLAEHGDEVALVIVEPLLQGAGGIRIGDAAVLRRIADLTRAAGAWLVADEVATGFGRTGTLFACEQAGVVPDLMCLAKALTGGMVTLGATAVRAPLFERFLGPTRREAFLHGHTYTGNPIACAAALASLDLIESEGTVARLARMETQWAAAAPGFSALPGVANVRWKGGVFALDLVGGPGGYLDPVERRVHRAALAEGLYVRPLGNVVYLWPPACVTDEELDWMLDVLRRVVEQEVTA